MERAFYECLAQLWPADPAFEWLLWSPDDQEEADEDGPTPIVLETLNGSWEKCFFSNVCFIFSLYYSHFETAFAY